MSKYPSVKDRSYSSAKEKWHHIIFGADTIEGRRFDIWLLWVILFSVLTLMADSVSHLHDNYGTLFKYLEYGFTAIFSLEYIARLYVSENKKKYAFSFYGVIDLISTVPTYLSFFFPGSQASRVFRILRTVRLLRVFKVLRLTSFMGEAQGMGKALKRSGAKITVFFGVVLVCLLYTSPSPRD